MKIGLVGLAASHGWSFGRLLIERGTPFAAVWDPQAHRLDRYLRDYAPATMLPPAEMARQGLDGVMICGVNGDHSIDAEPFLRAGIPVYINKPTVTTDGDLLRLMAAVQAAGTPLLATSAVRYAPAVVALRDAVQAGELGHVLGGTATVCHSIGGYLGPQTCWQDDPLQGGGALINLGAHGMDLLTACLGTAVEEVRAVRGVSTFAGTSSEDGALIALQLAGGVTGAVQVVGGEVAQGYYLTLFGTAGIRHVALTDAVPAAAAAGRAPTIAEIHAHYGFDGLLDRFLTMCRTGALPEDAPDWQAVATALLMARAQAPAPGHAVDVDRH